MKCTNYALLRGNIQLVFQSYLWFSIFELRDASAMVAYELQLSFCKFSVIFKKEYFVWVEKFYELFKNCFRDLRIVGWDNFQQEYSYEAENYVTFDLICKKKEPLSKYFRDKREIYFADVINNFNLNFRF